MVRQAQAYREHQPAVSGELEVGSDGVQFAAPALECRLPLDGLVCRTGGVANQFVYLSHPDRPGLEIVCEDLSLLQEPPLASLASAQQALSDRRGYRRRLWGCGLGTILLVAAGLSLVLLLILSIVFGLMNL